MEVMLTIVGWMVFGGAAGYAVERWKWVYIVFLAALGISLIADPQVPDLIGSSNGGTWYETIAFVGGALLGMRIAKNETVQAQ